MESGWCALIEETLGVCFPLGADDHAPIMRMRAVRVRSESDAEYCSEQMQYRFQRLLYYYYNRIKESIFYPRYV